MWKLREGFRWEYSTPLATVVVVGDKFLILFGNCTIGWSKAKDTEDAKRRGVAVMEDFLDNWVRRQNERISNN